MLAEVPCEFPCMEPPGNGSGVFGARPVAACRIDVPSAVPVQGLHSGQLVEVGRGLGYGHVLASANAWRSHAFWGKFWGLITAKSS